MSCSDDDQRNFTLRESEYKGNVVKENQRDKGSISSVYNFFTPLSGLSIDVDEDIAQKKMFGNFGKEEVDKQSNSSKSTPNLGREVSGQDRTSSRSSLSEFCQDSDSWIEQEVFGENTEEEDTDIISSFSTFNKLMIQLNDDHKITEARGIEAANGGMHSLCGKKDNDLPEVFINELNAQVPIAGEEANALDAELNFQITKDATTDENCITLDLDIMNNDSTKEVNCDEKTSSEDSSYSQLVYVRMDSEGLAHHPAPGIEERTDSPLYCSTTPLLGSRKNSPEGSSCSNDLDQALAEEASAKGEVESESEEEIDLTAFKQLILLNAGEESFNQDLYQVREREGVGVKKANTFLSITEERGYKKCNPKERFWKLPICEK
jgi:hypothetical protein